MHPDPGPATFGHHGLGPHVVGQRVVVRRLVPGETGPTGGPAFTDVLGVCERWADGEALVRRADGEAVVIPTSLIVSGKPVPPRASRLMRVTRKEVEKHVDGIGEPVWLGSVSQLARAYGASEDVTMSGSEWSFLCERDGRCAHGELREDWLVIDQLDDVTLLGNLLERAAEEGVGIVAFTDPRVEEYPFWSDLIPR